MDEYVVESPVEGTQAPVDPRRALLLPLWRGRYLVLATIILGIMGGVLSGVTRPNTYLSVGKLIFRAGAREELTPEMSVTGSAGGYGMGGRNVVNDELHLLSAPQVFEEAARIVTPAEIFQPYDPSAKDREDTPGVTALFHRWQSWWFRNSGDSDDLLDHSIDDCERCCHLAALAMERHLSIQAEPGSNVITVSYTTHDPKLAQEVVAAFLKAAITHHRKIYETTPALEFLNVRMEESEKALRGADDEFTNFKTVCGVPDFESEQRALSIEIRTLESQMAEDRSRIEDLRASTTEWKALLASLPETIELRTEHNLQPNPDRAALMLRINTLEDSLAALERRVGGTSHERDLEREQLAGQIESAKKHLQEQLPFLDAGPSVTRSANPRHVRLTQSLDEGRVQLAALEAGAATRVTQLEERKARQMSVTQCGPNFLSLQRKSNIARDTFEGFRTQRDRAKLMSSMDQIEMSNLRPIQEATLPNEKEGPLRGKLVLLGILLGGVAGCGLAFVKNMIGYRIHDATEVQQLLGLTVLGVFPQVRSSSAPGKRVPRSAAI